MEFEQSKIRILGFIFVFTFLLFFEFYNMDKTAFNITTKENLNKKGNNIECNIKNYRL